MLDKRIWWLAFIVGIAAAAGIYGVQRSDKPDASPSIRHIKDVSAEEFRGQAAAESGDRTGDAAKVPEAESRKRTSPDTRDHSAGILDAVSVRVWLSGEKRVEKVPLEIYVRGVVAGEMPIEFEPEALKAQAIAARTYIVKRLTNRETVPAGKGKADVDDTVASQVYIPLRGLLERWTGQAARSNLDKLNKAVEETKGMIITYEGEPIQAAFFSTSNGYTESSGEYWSLQLPYLQSVPSPWDRGLSPRFSETVTMKLSDFYQRLGIPRKERKQIRVLSLTKGNRIKEFAVGAIRLSGREVRERLNLRSSQFTWRINGKEISITTYGSGHGVGMSQWGANGMAKAGKNARQILEYYYTGAKVQQAGKLPDRI